MSQGAARVERPAEGCAQIVVFSLEAAEPRRLVDSLELRLGLLCQFQPIECVALARLFERTSRRQLLERELAQDREHAVATVLSDDQRAIHQPFEALEDFCLGADSFRGVYSPATREHRHHGPRSC